MKRMIEAKAKINARLPEKTRGVHRSRTGADRTDLDRRQISKKEVDRRLDRVRPRPDRNRPI